MPTRVCPVLGYPPLGGVNGNQKKGDKQNIHKMLREIGSIMFGTMIIRSTCSTKDVRYVEEEPFEETMTWMNFG